MTESTAFALFYMLIGAMLCAFYEWGRQRFITHTCKKYGLSRKIDGHIDWTVKQPIDDLLWDTDADACTEIEYALPSECDKKQEEDSN